MIHTISPTFWVILLTIHLRRVGNKHRTWEMNKHRALNKRRSFVLKKLEKIIFSIFDTNLMNKVIGPGKESKNNKRRAYVYSGV